LGQFPTSSFYANYKKARLCLYGATTLVGPANESLWGALFKQSELFTRPDLYSNVADPIP
jgi:hypothetical protein